MKAPEELQDWSAVSYTELNFKGFEPKEQRFFRKAALLSQFLDAKNTRGSGKIKDLIFAAIASFARLRIRMGIYGLAPEMLILRHKTRGTRST